MLSRSLCFASAAVCLTLAGCQGENARNSRANGSNGGAPMTASGELAIANPKPMDAQAAFFGGTVGIEAMLAKSDIEWKNANPADGNSRGGGGVLSGLGGGGGGGRRGGGPGGGGRRGGGGGEAPAPSDSNTIPRTAKIPTSNAPPIQLRLRLTNHTDQSLDVEVLDFNSELGNFAVQPEKITVPPNATVEADPMTSRLGVPAVEEIPITVRLRAGGKAGKTEQQIVMLKPRSDEPAPAK